MKKSNLGFLGIISFVIGMAAGFTINVLATWADFEASMFQSAIKADEGLPGLRCPILIGEDQEGLITASIKNPNDRAISPKIRASVSDGSMIVVSVTDERVELEPGETVELQWQVNQANAAWERFIAFRVYQFQSYPEPSRASSCGVYVVNIAGINGTTLTAALYVVCLVGMVFGIWSWNRSHHPMKKAVRDIFVAMIFLSSFIIAGLLINLFGWFLLSAFFLVLSFLSVIVILAYLFSSI